MHKSAGKLSLLGRIFFYGYFFYRYCVINSTLFAKLRLKKRKNILCSTWGEVGVGRDGVILEGRDGRGLEK